MTAIEQTNITLFDTNLADNKDTYIFVSRKSNANNKWIDFKHKEELVWEKYQIKETDMRQKTATISTPQYIDLTTGVYAVMITSKLHEDFGGVIIGVDYDKKNGLYNYQCQDHSRVMQSKVDMVVRNTKVHTILKYLITTGILTDNSKKKEVKKRLSGLRPAWQYDQSMYGSIIGFNPMTQKKNMIIRDKSWIEAIRDIVYGTGAYIDVYFDKYGIIHIEPYHKDDLFNTGLYLTTPEIASAKYKFDTTNIQTGTIVKNNDTQHIGKQYFANELVNLDLTVFFGALSSMVNNPNDAIKTTTTPSTNKTSNKTNKKTTGKKSTTAKKVNNPYGTKKKRVYLSIDNISGKSSDMKKMTDMKKLLQKEGWTVEIMGVGPSTHYAQRSKCKKGIWFTLYGGFCAGTLREQCTSDWFLNPLKKNKSRTIVGFFPPAETGILKGGSYYKHLGPAHDWQGNRSYANIDYPAKFMSNHGVPFMFGKNAKQMVSKFLAGGDNYATEGNSYKYYGSWTKHKLKWLK